MEGDRWFGFAKGDMEAALYWSDIVSQGSGERLRGLLKRENINQHELAVNSEISEAAISGFIKNGLRTAKASTLVKLALYFDVSIDWLLGLTSENNKSRDELVKQLSELTGFSDNAMAALLGSIDYHERGFDNEYGGALGYILDKSYRDKRSFIEWLETARVEAYLYRNKENADIYEMPYGEFDENGEKEKFIFSGKNAIEIMVTLAVNKFERLAREYIKQEMKKPPDDPEELDEEEEEEDQE